ncbi:hypothetical protein JCM11641_006561 [Rhodosporidiobolus odoratus]
MQHPIQVLCSTTEHVITASNTLLSCFDAATNAPISTATPHTALIRLVATYKDDQTNSNYLISTGEDKQLVVSSLPSLEVVNKRELSKRANALDVTEKGEIVVGDKFGDVYIFPLQYTPPPPSDPKPKPEDAPAHHPILGHVSMLNTLALIPENKAVGIDRDLIATGDRDEHVRVSWFPRGEVIEGYGWGSKAFVSSLLYLAPSTTPTPSPAYLLSGGADPTLQLFSLPSLALVGQFPIETLLMPHIAVGPESPTPVPAGRKKDKKGGLQKKGNGKVTEGEGEGEGEKAEAEAEVEVEVEEEPEEPARGGRELKKGLAVIKMIEVGTTRENGGVVVLAAGSTALLYIPFSLLLPHLATSSPDLPAVPSLLPVPHPILDFTPLPVPSSSSSACEFLLSLDTSRSLSSTSPFSAPSTETPPEPNDEPQAQPQPQTQTQAPLARVSLTTSGTLRALPTLSTDTVLLSTAISTLPEIKGKGKGKGGKQTKLPLLPSVASLYPVLQLLHHPGDIDDFGVGVGGEDEGGAGAGAEAGENKAKKGQGRKKDKIKVKPGVKDGPASARYRGKKRGSEAEDVDGGEAGGEGEDGGRGYKRAKGRAETLRRYEEAKRKLEEAKKVGGGEGQASLTEGEKEAVEEIEGEAKGTQAAEEEGAMVA